MQPLLAGYISGKTDFIASLVSILDCNLLFQLVSAITVQRVRIVIPPNFPESVTEIIQVDIDLRVVIVDTRLESTGIAWVVNIRASMSLADHRGRDSHERARRASSPLYLHASHCLANRQPRGMHDILVTKDRTPLTLLTIVGSSWIDFCHHSIPASTRSL